MNPLDDLRQMQAAVQDALYPVLVRHPRPSRASFARRPGTCGSISRKPQPSTRATMDALLKVELIAVKPMVPARWTRCSMVKQKGGKRDRRPCSGLHNGTLALRNSRRRRSDGRTGKMLNAGHAITRSTGCAISPPTKSASSKCTDVVNTVSGALIWGLRMAVQALVAP